MISSLLSTVGGLLSGGVQQISEKTGVQSSVVASVIEQANSYLQKDERVAKQLAEEVDAARQHDIKTFDTADAFSNRLRSLVRPLCTFICLGWYIFARVNHIPLTPEDYSIIGGVLAFWFGFRPFEKRKK